MAAVVSSVSNVVFRGPHARLPEAQRAVFAPFQKDLSHLRRVRVMPYASRYHGVNGYDPAAHTAAAASEEEGSGKKDASKSNLVSTLEAALAPIFPQVVDLDGRVFGEPLRPDLLQRVVVYQRAKWRQGTARAKTRSEVSHSTKKLRPQKGQGRARIGAGRESQHRGGGKAFPPRGPRDFSIDLPVKVRAKALKSALSAKAARGELTIVDGLAMPDPKTQHLTSFLNDLKISWAVKSGGGGGAVLIPGDKDEAEAVRLSAFNLPAVEVIPAHGIQVYALLQREHTVVSLRGLSALYRRLLGDDAPREEWMPQIDNLD